MPKQKMELWNLSDIPEEDVVGKPVVWMDLNTHLYQACLNYNKREPVNPALWADSAREALRDAGLGNRGFYYLFITNRQRHPDSQFYFVAGYEYVKGSPLVEGYVTAQYLLSQYGIYMKVPVVHNN